MHPKAKEGNILGCLHVYKYNHLVFIYYLIFVLLIRKV
jgi:hypothetical protein